MNLNPCIRRGIDFIAAAQLPDGGFLARSSPDPTDFTHSRSYRTTFVPSFILHALADCRLPASEDIKQRTADYLIAQKSQTWSFNYWDRTSPEYRSRPYPDDLDDTFCALAAIARYNPALIDGAALAAASHLLIACEQAVGGPYRTWLVKPDAPIRWQDIDLIVNANIGYFMRLQQITLPALTTYLQTEIIQRRLSSLYYPGSIMTAYCLSRTQLDGKAKKVLQEVITAEGRTLSQMTALQTALMLSTCIRLGMPSATLTADADRLRRLQSADGSWPAAAFCIDPMVDKRTHYSGADALTTALCIESLQFYEAANANRQMILRKAPIYGRPQGSSVRRLVRGEIKHHQQTELYALLQQVYRRIVGIDADYQISGMPWLVAGSLGFKLDNEVGRSLGLISWWGWMAYTTYDDFLDDEPNRRLLPAANICLRQLAVCIERTLPTCPDFKTEAHAILDRMEVANSWELQHCRGTKRQNMLHIANLPDYGDYQKLADRSFGHALAGLGVLYANGETAASHQISSLRSYYRHYIIARQLNDDAHDWEADLHAGHINSVATALLKHWSVSQGKSVSIIDLKHDIPALRLLLWQDIIVDICHQIKGHIAAARAVLSDSTNTAGSAPFLEALLQPIEASAERALSGRRERLDFMESF